MAAADAPPSHPPATEGSSECCLTPRVWCLCVCAWPREMPTLGFPQPQERNGGPRNQGTQDSSLIPRTPLGSECGARNWSPAQPQYCHLCTHPCKSPEDCPPQKLPSRESLCQLWSGEVGPQPSTSATSLPDPEQKSSSGCGAYLTPSSLPVLQPARLSPTSCTGLACVPLAPVLFALLPFCSAFALHWCGGPGSQLLSCYLLTLRRKVSKLAGAGWKFFAALSQLLGWAPGRPAILALIAAYRTPYCLHIGRAGLVVPSAVYLPAGELWPASRCPQSRDRRDRRLTP